MRFMSLCRFFAVWGIVTAWFALFIPWQGWNDPDAYYHATVSKQIWQSGPLKTFSALDLTLLGTEYADLHFGFHIIVALFTAVFGDLMGLRIASILLAGLCVTVLEACLRWLRVRHSWVWAGLLAVSYPFVFRALLGKATPIALTLFVVGVAAAWKRQPWLVGLATFAYALSHGGWLYLAGSVVLLASGDVIYSHVVSDRTLRTSIFDARWREIGTAWMGGLLGLCLHPNFPHVFTFAWAQIVTIGLGTPFQHVSMGGEWLPLDVTGMISGYAMWIILALIGLSGLLFARRPTLDEDHARLLVSVGLIMAVLTALTFKSRRNIEFLTPVVAVWCGVLWSLVDSKALWRSFTKTLRFVPVFISLVFAAVVAKQLTELYRDMHPPNYPDEVYAASMRVISSQALPGDRIFHSSWDEFPMLYHADQRLKYISGLDPTFLYIASSTLSDQVRDVTWDFSTSTADQTWSLIHTQLDSRFVFVSKKNHQKFLQRLNEDSRYERIADQGDSAVFRVGSLAE